MSQVRAGRSTHRGAGMRSHKPYGLLDGRAPACGACGKAEKLIAFRSPAQLENRRLRVPEPWTFAAREHSGRVDRPCRARDLGFGGLRLAATADQPRPPPRVGRVAGKPPASCAAGRVRLFFFFLVRGGARVETWFLQECAEA